MAQHHFKVDSDHVGIGFSANHVRCSIGRGVHSSVFDFATRPLAQFQIQEFTPALIHRV